MYSHPQQGGGQDARELRRQAGQWLKQLRQRKQLSQRELARRVNVEFYTFISQIESGKGRIPPDRYRLWAEALDVDTTTFVKTLMSYYDPVTYELLFAQDAEQQADFPGSKISAYDARHR